MGGLFEIISFVQPSSSRLHVLLLEKEKTTSELEELNTTNNASSHFAPSQRKINRQMKIHHDSHWCEKSEYKAKPNSGKLG